VRGQKICEKIFGAKFLQEKSPWLLNISGIMYENLLKLNAVTASLLKCCFDGGGQNQILPADIIQFIDENVPPGSSEAVPNFVLNELREQNYFLAAIKYINKRIHMDKINDETPINDEESFV